MQYFEEVLISRYRLGLAAVCRIHLLTTIMESRSLESVGSTLLNMISTKGRRAFDAQWASFKDHIESIEPGDWPRFFDRHALLRIAALRGREEAVKLLLEPFRLPVLDDRQVETGATALHEAAFNGHAHIVELLLSHGASVDLLTSDTGESALHRALSRTRFRTPRPPMSLDGTVKVLLNAGANPNLNDLQWQTPVHYAARNGHSGVFALLLENPGNFGSRDRFDRGGNTPLHVAALMGHVEEVDILLGHSAVHIDTTNKRKETPLHLAANHVQTGQATEWSRHDETVRLLLDRGADTTHLKIDGMTMLDWAASDNGKSNAANLILRKEYSSWPASWFQESNAPPSWQENPESFGPKHEIAAQAFKASAMWFCLRYDETYGPQHRAVDHSQRYISSVEDMVYNTANFSNLFDTVNPRLKEGFVWFNIPENNMRWVLDLHSQICRDERGSLSDAAQIDPKSFMTWFHASRPQGLAPQVRENVHYGSNRSIRTLFISIPYLSVESHKRRCMYEDIVHGYRSSLASTYDSRNEKDLHPYAHLLSAYGSIYENGQFRKTLDKYRYHDLRQTDRRDTSQVILRASQAQNFRDDPDLEHRLLESTEFDGFRSQWWPRDGVPSGRPDDLPKHDGDGEVLMVDQACIWVLGDGKLRFVTRLRKLTAHFHMLSLEIMFIQSLHTHQPRRLDPE